MIDDNKDNPPLRYYVSDYEKLRESALKWKLGCLTCVVALIIIAILETIR